MQLLKAEPPAPVKSLEELFAIAHAMEEEAATRYAEIAERMRQEGNPSVAEVFERLSSDEQGHLDNVVYWSQREKGKAPDPAQIRWTIPETFDDEGAATTDPRLQGAYRTLSMAVRNEERAFAFWTYVSAHAQSEDVRRAAEVMAHEELGHVATLRRARRQAFHSERSGSASHQVGEVAPNVGDLERRLAELLDALAEISSAANQEWLQSLAGEARHHAEELARAQLSVPDSRLPVTTPDEPVALAELLAERYLEAADRLHDEEAVARAQTYAGRAINRLAWLRADLPEISAHRGQPGS
jgi:rubrerythrin